METHFDGIERSHDDMSREKVMDDLKALARDAEELLKATADDVGEKMSDKAKEARARLEAAVDRAKSSASRWEDRTVAAARAADRVVRQHPYETIGGGFVIGLLIGVLLTRR